jgi:hypothetical protein
MSLRKSPLFNVNIFDQHFSPFKKKVETMVETASTKVEFS